MGLVLRIGSSFLLNPTLTTSHEPCLHKMLPCGHPCHTWDLGPMGSGKSQLPCFRRLRLHKLTLSDVGLGTTSHTRLRARDQYTSSTFIGGKGGDGPSSLHTTLEGPTYYVKCKMVVKVYTWTIFKNHLS